MSDPRPFLKRELDVARQRLSAVGDDAEVEAWADEGALTPGEFRALIDGAVDTAEHKFLASAVLAERLSTPIRKCVDVCPGSHAA